jgi:hypothetical protein
MERIFSSTILTTSATSVEPLQVPPPMRWASLIEAHTRDWQFVRQYARFDPHEWPDDPELCGGPDDRNPVIDGHMTVTLPGDRKK